MADHRAKGRGGWQYIRARPPRHLPHAIQDRMAEPENRWSRQPNEGLLGWRVNVAGWPRNN